MTESEIREKLSALSIEEETLKGKHGGLQNEILRLKRYQKEARAVQEQLQEVWRQQEALRLEMFRIAIDGIETPFGPITVQ